MAYQYDPMQFAEAKAGIVGRDYAAYGNIAANAVSSVFTELPKLQKMQNANKLIDKGIVDIRNEYIKQLTDAGVAPEKAAITARRYYMDRMPDESASEAATRLVKVDDSARANLKALLEQSNQAKFQSGVAAVGAPASEQQLAGMRQGKTPEQYTDALMASMQQKPDFLGGPKANPQQVQDIGQQNQIPQEQIDKSAQYRGAIGRQSAQEQGAMGPQMTQFEAMQAAQAATGQPLTPQGEKLAGALPKESATADPLFQLKKEKAVLDNELTTVRIASEKALKAQREKPGQVKMSEDIYKNAFDMRFKVQDAHTKQSNLVKALEKAAKESTKVNDFEAMTALQKDLGEAGYTGPITPESIRNSLRDAQVIEAQTKQDLNLAMELEKEALKASPSALAGAARTAQSNITAEKEKQIADIIKEAGALTPTSTGPQGSLTSAAVQGMRDYAMTNGIPQDVLNEAIDRWAGKTQAPQMISSAMGRPSAVTDSMALAGLPPTVKATYDSLAVTDPRKSAILNRAREIIAAGRQ
jgi:hypothetical protein